MTFWLQCWFWEVNLPDSSNITKSVTPWSLSLSLSLSLISLADWAARAPESGNPQNSRGLPLVCNTPVVWASGTTLHGSGLHPAVPPSNVNINPLTTRYPGDLLSSVNILRSKQDGQNFPDNAFSWMKIYEFCLRFHWSLLLSFALTIFQHWFR